MNFQLILDTKDQSPYISKLQKEEEIEQSRDELIYIFTSRNCKQNISSLSRDGLGSLTRPLCLSSQLATTLSTNSLTHC